LRPAPEESEDFIEKAVAGEVPRHGRFILDFPYGALSSRPKDLKNLKFEFRQPREFHRSYYKKTDLYYVIVGLTVVVKSPEGLFYSLRFGVSHGKIQA
jgi:hypothetical protein